MKAILLIFFCAILAYISVALLVYVPCYSWFYWTANIPSNSFFNTFWANSLIDGIRYVCGGSIFILLCGAWYILYVLARGTSLKAQLDRIIGLCVAALVYACVANYYQLDGMKTDVAGGVVGLSINRILFAYIDPFVVVAGLYVSMIACFFLVTQPLLIILTHRLHNFVSGRKKVSFSWIAYIPGYSFVKELGYLYIQALFRIGAYVQSSFRTSVIPARHEWDKELKLLLQGLQSTNFNEQQVYQDIVCVKENHLLQNHYEGLERDSVVYKSVNQTCNEHRQYVLPNIPPLKKTAGITSTYQEHIERRTKLLEEKLSRFGITGVLTAVKPGPVVTVFEFRPSIDTKLSKIISLEDDLSLALSATSVRIIAPIPGTDVVGFEVANMHRTPVESSTIFHSPLYKNCKGILPLVLGENTIGDPVVVDLATMPHLLIAGSTGSGKSVALNTMLVSLLCKKTPDEMRLILIDPKRLEFAAYTDIAHLLFPIVVDPKKALLVLRWATKLMQDRYDEMASLGARNINDYNDNVARSSENKKMPHIVIIIDELADLLLTAGREVETVIIRIAQMARAAGIHMIVATQRPSVDVITGLVKVNFPSRISFRVTSRGDSRTILDNCGAERLLGKGDMLFLDAGSAYMKRVHGCYISDEEIKSVVSHIKKQYPVQYLDMTQEFEQMDSSTQSSDCDDALYDEVVYFLQDIDEVSISLIQRKFRIGYNRSARLIEKLENQGLIMPPDGSKARKVIR